MYMPMQRAEDLADFENRLNLVRMELEQLHKPPDESTLVVAFIQGLREEFKTAAQLLSTGVVDAFTLDDAVQHVRDSMLIVSTQADVPIFAFHAEAHATPTLASVTQDAMATQLSTLAAQVQSLAESVAAVLASSSRSGRGNDNREPIVCTYCDRRGHAEVDCFKRQRDLKRKAEAEAHVAIAVVVASGPLSLASPSPPATVVPRAMPSYLDHMPHVIEDTSFVAADVSFFDAFHETPLFVPSPLTLMDDICDDNEVTTIPYADDMLFTYRDAVTHSRAHHTMPVNCPLTAIHIPPSDDTDDCPSLVSDSDDMFCTDEEDDVIHMAIRMDSCYTEVVPAPQGACFGG
jgi:hypothetical protein